MALRAIDSIKVLIAPFLPFSSERLHRMLGYEQPMFGELHIETYQESQRSHEVLTYHAGNASGRWQPSELQPGQKLNQPEPLYRKLDDEIIEQERARLGAPRP